MNTLKAAVISLSGKEVVHFKKTLLFSMFKPDILNIKRKIRDKHICLLLYNEILCLLPFFMRFKAFSMYTKGSLLSHNAAFMVLFGAIR